MANPGGLVFTVHIAKRMDEFPEIPVSRRSGCAVVKLAGNSPQGRRPLALAIAASDAPHRPATLHVLYANAGSDRLSPTAWQRLRSSIASRAFIVG